MLIPKKAIALVIYYAMVVGISLQVPRGPYFGFQIVSEIFLFLPPALYMNRTSLSNIVSYGLAAVIVGQFFALIYHVIGMLSVAYDYNPFILVGPIDYWGILWFPLPCFFLITVYQEFYGPDVRQVSPSNALSLLLVSIYGLGVIAIGQETIRTVEFAYILLIIPVLILPVLALSLLRGSKQAYDILSSLVLLSPFMIVYTVINSVHYNGWTFPGSYVYVLTLFGTSIPIEEILGWGLLFPAAVISLFHLISRTPEEL